MKGVHLLCLVLLIVLAIPLFADHDLVNTVVEFSAISTLNEEVLFTDQELFDSNVPVLSVGLNERYLPTITKSKQSVLIEKTGMLNTKRTIHGGVKRTNLRKH